MDPVLLVKQQEVVYEIVQ